MSIRTYTELLNFASLEDRYRYLKLGGEVGAETFGFDRWINQEFYASRDWKQARNHVIARDNGCDLGLEGYEIYDKVFVHHMNPLTSGQIIRNDEDIINPEFLITVSFNTHQAIHYGDENLLPRPLVERRPGDTKLW